MANPTATIERYVGGGKLFYTPYQNGAYGTEIEIGDVYDVFLNVGADTAEAFSQSSGPELLVEDAVVAVNSMFKYKTKNVNKENMAMATMGTLTTETFAISDTLPDGTTATEETVVDKIIGLDKPLQLGKYRVVGEPLNDTAKRPVLVVHLASVKPTEDVAYVSKEFMNLGFEGKVRDTADGYFDEYLMDVA